MFWKKRRIKRRRLPPDRRREPRFADGVEINLVPQETAGVRGDKRSYYARTKNASPSGLKVESADPIPVGTILTVRLHSPKTRKDIRATAEVKWLTPVGDGKAYEIGLEFVKTTINSIMDLVEHIYKG
ncbi:MAG TPA: PilZ domain-containing protein [Candidatus Desulfaltia sp.]|nr:PilZ domain-containing protein [Candidatus Desulfaltia sp.]